MATLFKKTGDPAYLKVVLLQEVIREDEKTQLNVTVAEGDIFCFKAEGESPKYLANDVCYWICGHERSAIKVMGKDQTSVDQWIHWENEKLQPAVWSSILIDSLTDELISCLKVLDNHLSQTGRQYVCDDSVTLADVIIWATLYILLAPQATTSKLLETQHVNVFQWFANLSTKKSFTDAIKTASNDSGYSVFHEYIMKNQKQETSTDISAAEIEAAKNFWERGHLSIPKPIKREHPILPVSGERNILVTSALPYVNNVPHLGNIIGCVLSGDVFARYCRLRNYRTIYICGTDEYGTATETKALEEKTTPQEICQKYFKIQEEVYNWFGIQFDYFGRTSTPQQTEIAQDIFTRLNERGFILKDTVEQLLCETCNMFLADRFVEGHCPLCNYEDARGDQCDKCGKLINATELKNPRCKVCSNQPILKSSNHLFLDLPKLEEEVHKWSKQSCKEGLWSANAEQITTTWLRDGLKPRCITRDLKWGTPVPLEGYENKVFYVWFDAPIGYLSITACYTKEWEKWWKNPKDVQLYQFMAKDNVPFHTVVFPCSLIGAQDNYTLLNHISSTEYLNYEDGKFSKSRGVGVFGTDAKDTDIPVDTFRFYLLYIRPETQDSAFSWTDFVLKCNTELLNNLGNFINRVLVFTKNNFNSVLQEISLTEEDVVFVAKINRVLTGYLQCLESIKLRDGLRHILSVSRLGNSYIQANKPWELVKGSQDDKRRAGSVLGLSANVVCLLSVMMQPYMPEASKKLQQQLQAPEDCNVLPDTMVQILPPGHKIGTPAPMFSKIEESVAKKLKERFSGKQDNAKREDNLDPKTSLKEQLQKQISLVDGLRANSATSKQQLDEEVKKLQLLQEKVGKK